MLALTTSGTRYVLPGVTQVVCTSTNVAVYRIISGLALPAAVDQSVDPSRAEG